MFFQEIATDLQKIFSTWGNECKVYMNHFNAQLEKWAQNKD
jgi:hypothetical protein